MKFCQDCLQDCCKGCSQDCRQDCCKDWLSIVIASPSASSLSIFGIFFACFIACTWRRIFGTFSIKQFLPIGTISAKTTTSGSIVPSLFLQVLSKPGQEVMCGLVLASEEVWGESAQQKMILLHQLPFDTHLPSRIWHLAFLDSQDLAFGIFDTAI